MSMIIIKY